MYDHSKVFIHNALMLYLLKKSIGMVYYFCPKGFIQQVCRCFCFHILTKNYSWLTTMPDTIENKKYKNNWKTVFPHRVKACWDKMIAWPLILKGVFSMYSIREMKTSSHINIYIPVLGSYNCHRTIYDVQAISFLPTDLWGFKMVPFKGLCSPSNINWNFPGLVVIWLF